MSRPLLLAAALAMGLSACIAPATAARLPAPILDPKETLASATAILSGGCFWGVQGVFEHVRGVKKVLSGYAGGPRALASYDLVSTGTTGHAETVQILFDPRVISYGEILRIFFSVATDPTQVNAQFPDEGPQYRSEIYFMSEGQRVTAQHYVDQLNAAKAFRRPIATHIDPFKGFYVAEDHHQDYLIRNPGSPYIATYDLPKIAALKATFPEHYRAEPVRAG